MHNPQYKLTHPVCRTSRPPISDQIPKEQYQRRPDTHYEPCPPGRTTPDRPVYQFRAHQNGLASSSPFIHRCWLWGGSTVRIDIWSPCRPHIRVDWHSSPVPIDIISAWTDRLPGPASTGTGTSGVAHAGGGAKGDGGRCEDGRHRTGVRRGVRYGDCRRTHREPLPERQACRGSYRLRPAPGLKTPISSGSRLMTANS